MREDQVENGVKFLVHPKVTTAPLSQRISFLENKVIYEFIFVKYHHLNSNQRDRQRGILNISCLPGCVVLSTQHTS